MTANELMVGNWVVRKDEEYQITSATIVSVERCESTAMPILLTEEWIIRFGFEKTDENTAGAIWQINGEEEYHLDDCKIIEWKKGLHKGLFFRRNKVIEYVHQLQNIYFALYNEELSVKSKN